MTDNWPPRFFTHPYTIRKPHYELVNFKGTRTGVMQERRGGYVVVNLENGHKATAVGTCAYHLTNYGRGTETPASKEALHRALRYLFGETDGPGDVIAVKL